MCLCMIDFYLNQINSGKSFDPDEIAHQVQNLSSIIFPLFDMKEREASDYPGIVADSRKELINKYYWRGI